jgi:hypothetical protein
MGLSVLVRLLIGRSDFPCTRSNRASFTISRIGFHLHQGILLRIVVLAATNPEALIEAPRACQCW